MMKREINITEKFFLTERGWRPEDRIKKTKAGSAI